MADIPALRMVATRLGPADRHDHLRCERADGSATEVALPRQGALPHDLLHAIVESALGFSDGFIGLVARGADIAFAAEQFRDYIDPARHAQVAQAESVVESLQAQLWSGAFDGEAFAYGVETACAMRGVAAPDFSVCDPRARLFEPAAVLGAAWQALPPRAQWSLEFPLAPGFHHALAA
ncbi:MAG: hypothetical protein ACTHKZ_02985 [Lysobacteraceae bacterium]